ncbi:3'-5' exonuclease [Amycolatopsis sp. NBC_00345]|uniref:3'-5' exonuclease n=1 Tax=Amycolatopsis sp. NBC_00345 TaxID=2975955 RepID=UPI002E275A16
MGRTRFVVIDFEGLTPVGRAPVPVEVAAVTVVCRGDGTLEELGQFGSLMKPPAGVAVTAFDQAAGITRALLATAPPAREVMAALDRHVHDPAEAAGAEVRLVAQNAPTERTMLHGQRDHCPRLAGTPLLDTLRLARASLPELTAHGLSELARYFGVTIPPDRHRALADVELTIAVLRELLTRGPWETLLDLERTAALQPKRVEPAGEQTGLF